MATTDSVQAIPAGPNRFAQFVALRVGRLPPLIWIYLLTILFPISFNVGPLAMSGMRLLLIFATIPMVMMLLSGKAGKVIPTDILFALHILWATLAIGVNNPTRVVENMGSTGIEFVGGYLLGRVFIRTPEQFLALSRALFVIIIVILPLALYENFTGHSPMIDIISSIPGFDSFHPVDMPKRMNLHRPQVIFAHPIHYGVFCSVMFAICFVGFRGTFSTFTRLLVSGLIACSAFLSLSSGALLAVMLQGGLITWAALMRNNPKKWHVLVAILAFFYVVIDLLSNRTPIEVFMTYATFSAHNAYWRRTIFEWGMINVWANPILGLGLRQWIRPHWMGSGSMDNFWLVMAVRYGIPAFLFLAVGYLDLLRRIMLRDFSNDEPVARIRLAWMIVFVGLTFSLTTVHVWTAVYSFIFFMVGSGVWLVGYQPAQAAAGAVAGGEPVPAGRSGPSYRRAPVAVMHSRPRETETAVERTELRHSRDPVETETPPPPEPPAPKRSDVRYTRFHPDDRPSRKDRR